MACRYSRNAGQTSRDDALDHLRSIGIVADSRLRWRENEKLIDWDLVVLLADAISEQYPDKVIRGLRRRSHKVPLRTIKGAASNPLVQQILDDAGLMLNEDVLTFDTGPAITSTYATWTEEDFEAGDTDDKGWLDEEGVSMLPDEWDIEEGIDIVEKTARYLSGEGALEPSEWGPGGEGASTTWSIEPQTDMYTGETEERSYHLEGFSYRQLKAIQKRIMGR